ncbi:MAG: helix-turn-helix domain-containing protein [Coprococcus sp.]
MFIHRNTLMYRIEKVRKFTGLDVRNFDQAIVFKLAMVIHKHVKYKE